MSKDNEELVNAVLATTREQLSKAVFLCAELEAMLILEQKKTAWLEEQLKNLASTKVETND